MQVYPANVKPPRPQRINRNFRLDIALDRRLCRYVAENKGRRSKVIAAALTEYLDRIESATSEAA